MIVVVYLSLYTLIIIWLSLRVIDNRRKHRVSVGDGGVEALQIAIATQSNAVEYLIIASLLLVTLELNGGSQWFLHALGLALVLGRVYHVKGMFAKRLRYRVVGMKITIFSLVALAVLNVVYLPFDKLM